MLGGPSHRESLGATSEAANSSYPKPSSFQHEETKVPALSRAKRPGNRISTIETLQREVLLLERKKLRLEIRCLELWHVELLRNSRIPAATESNNACSSTAPFLNTLANLSKINSNRSEQYVGPPAPIENSQVLSLHGPVSTSNIVCICKSCLLGIEQLPVRDDILKGRYIFPSNQNRMLNL